MAVTHRLDEAKPKETTSPATPDSAADEGPEEEDERVIACRKCAATVSRPSAVMAASQVFPNPFGQMKVIVTLRWAESVDVVSPSTTDFTWFDGYSWSIVCCAACHAHLGWRYDAVGEATPARFYGLLRSAVTEAEG